MLLLGQYFKVGHTRTLFYLHSVVTQCERQIETGGGGECKGSLVCRVWCGWVGVWVLYVRLCGHALFSLWQTHTGWRACVVRISGSGRCRCLGIFQDELQSEHGGMLAVYKTNCQPWSFCLLIFSVYKKHFPSIMCVDKTTLIVHYVIIGALSYFFHPVCVSFIFLV